MALGGSSQEYKCTCCARGSVDLETHPCGQLSTHTLRACIEALEFQITQREVLFGRLRLQGACMYVCAIITHVYIYVDINTSSIYAR